MLLVHPVQEAVRFLPALLVLFVTGRSSQRSPWWDVAALAFVVLVGLSRWFTTRFRIEHGAIELERGLLRRQVIATPAERVRTVDVTAPPYHRLLGLARVEVGTAGGHGAERLVLDSLSAREAARLRDELLHRSAMAAASALGAAASSDFTAERPSHASAGSSASESLLLRLNPSWVRYAPLTTSGLVTAATLLGFSAQFLEALRRPEQGIDGAVSRLSAVGVWSLLGAGLLGGLVAVSLLSVIGYLLSYWDFRLTRHGGGSLSVRRGLLTTRATSIEEARMRGIEVGEPLGLRLAGASRLHAVTTGLPGHRGSSASALLAPPAPRAKVAAVAAAVVDDPAALTGGLVRHGPAARRRRYVRSIGGALLLAAVPAALGWWWHWPVGLLVLLLLVVVSSPFLAADRYAGLGHLLTDHHLVARAGSFSRRRDVLARTGVIGVVERQSFFQRRAGLATLTATTAAGRQGYSVIDVPLPEATRLAESLLPETVDQFLAVEPARGQAEAGGIQGSGTWPSP